MKETEKQSIKDTFSAMIKSIKQVINEEKQNVLNQRKIDEENKDSAASVKRSGGLFSGFKKLLGRDKDAKDMAPKGENEGSGGLFGLLKGFGSMILSAVSGLISFLKGGFSLLIKAIAGIAKVAGPLMRIMGGLAKFLGPMAAVAGAGAAGVAVGTKIYDEFGEEIGDAVDSTVETTKKFMGFETKEQKTQQAEAQAYKTSQNKKVEAIRSSLAAKASKGDTAALEKMKSLEATLSSSTMPENEKNQKITELYKELGLGSAAIAKEKTAELSTAPKMAEQVKAVEKINEVKEKLVEKNEQTKHNQVVNAPNNAVTNNNVVNGNNQSTFRQAVRNPESSIRKYLDSRFMAYSHNN